MDDDLELLWRFSQEQQSIARYHDEERSKLTQYLLAVAAAAVGVAKIGQASPIVNIVLGAFFVLTGCVGFVLAKQQSQECEGGAKCADVYRSELRRRCRGLPSEDHVPQYTHRRPWLFLHALVALLGIALIICVV